ncbi:putative nucleotide-diphospho-sugar transferase [candidate division CSSED10-310 bacterium]|uniref:Nucleotide-diphospho-sugar transferase n=1 Tax=candidate division CSSED10-310 bacterium TaxID=2855610 RepID=A0ABV6Z1H4_UNCC1
MQNKPFGKSRNLLHAFEAERKRRHHKLGLLLKQQNQHNVVLVMMLNQGHLDLFRNWVRSCDDRGIEVRSWTLVFAVDADAANGVEQLGFTSYFDPTSYGEHGKDAVKVFGDMQFRSLMFQKTAIVKDVLDLGYSLLFQDVDVVWKKDPLPYFLHPSRQRFDARFMYDGQNNMHAPLHVNTGFFWLNPTPESSRFWSAVLMHFDLIHRFGSQQMIVNQIILGHLFKGLKLNMLPEKDFSNGHLFSITNTARLPKDPYVIHCSWTGNLEHKIKKFKFAGLWYLDN